MISRPACTRQRVRNVNAATVEADQKVWLFSRDQCTDAACLKKAYADRVLP
jgi:uncharacterized protein